jgi:Putative prokaryotic signal transducing protein
LATMVQLALTQDLAEAEEIQAILSSAGIESELESADEDEPDSLEDVPTKVLVPEDALEAAQNAVEAMTDPDELIGGP